MAKARLRDKLIPIVVGSVIVICCLWLRITTLPAPHKIVSRLDKLVYDLQFSLIPAQPAEKDNPVVIIDVDEKSLAQYGNWPWHRSMVAKLTTALQNYGVAVIAFDVVFPVSETNIAKKLLEDLPADDKKKNADGVKMIENMVPFYEQEKPFIEAVGAKDTILGVIFHNHGDSEEGSLGESDVMIDADVLSRSIIPEMTGYTGNSRALQESAKYAGFVTTIPDNDGIIRSSPLLIQHKGKVYASLGLEAAKIFMVEDLIHAQFTSDGQYNYVSNVMLGKRRIATDKFGRVNIPYRGKGGSFPYISAADVISGKANGDILKDKIAFVGTSALGMGDLRATPVQSVYPGVEVHATIADAIINRSFPVYPPWAIGAEFLIIACVGIVAVLTFPFLSPLVLICFTFIMPVALVLMNAWFLQKLGLILSFVIADLMVVLLAMSNMAAGFLSESRSKQKIKWMFGQYVPAAHVEKMSGKMDDYGLSGESRDMTVLFSDIRNFTTISESLHAQELKNLLNEFFTPMTKIIFDKGGTVDKYVGDMLMAFWGAPLADEKHKGHAIAAGLAMVEETKNLKSKFTELGLPIIEVGIGINSGLMNVGDMGSSYRRSYTVLGDSVNLGSRLESLTKYYGVNIIVGPQTCHEQYDYFFRVLDKVRVKGKTDAVEIFEPIGLQKTLSRELREEVEAFHHVMKLYFKMKWKAAFKEFKGLCAEYPDRKLYQVYLERVKEFRDDPPGKKWDGVYIRTEK